MPQNVHVLGAGLAGLAAAHDFAKAGLQVTVLEKEDHVGGLAASFDIGDGFTVDLGPHRFHTASEAILEHVKGVLADNVHQRQRLSRIFIMGRLFNYPLKASNVVRNLPPLTLVKAFLDYFAIRIWNGIRPIPDDCFENYVIKRFGKTLYRIFFGTYTEKAWGIPCTQISADWASQRITLLNLWDTVKKTLFRPKNVPRTLVSRFHYPRQGGIGAISRGYVTAIESMGGRVLTGAPAVRLRHDGKVVTEIHYRRGGEVTVEPVERVVATIPVTVLCSLLDPPAPSDVLQANSLLRHKAIAFVYLKLDREKVTDDHWIYLPEKELAVHRISEFKNFSEQTCPPHRTVVCAEITCSYQDRIWTMDEAGLIDLATRDLVKVGLIKAEQVSGGTVRRERYAYPIYDLTYRENLQKVLAYVRSYANLDTTGRQGLFRYNNMDHSVAMGMKVARASQRDEHARVASGSEYFG
ncbi:MAG: FAD-dependent oxidoreductase [Planctomycetota bacterium]